MSRLRLGVIGVGHLGKEHARILASLPDVELVGIADANKDQAETVALRCSTRAYTDYRELLSALDAAVVAVPTTLHHAVAGECLRHGIALLVEKPLAATLAQADELVDLANHQGVPLQVGHIERFNPAFEELQCHPLQPKYITSERYGTFTGRSTDIGAVLDLMIHDLDLVQTLVASPVQRIEAMGVSILGGHEDMAQARLTFANGCVAQLSASRLSLAAQRRMQVWAPEGYATVDFARRHLTLIQPTMALCQQRLRPLDPAAINRLKSNLMGEYLDILERDCAAGDQLTREIEDFLQCVRLGARPRVSGADGRSTLALAMRILESIQNHLWEGQASGPAGPLHLPEPLGTLFSTQRKKAAA